MVAVVADVLRHGQPIIVALHLIDTTDDEHQGGQGGGPLHASLVSFAMAWCLWCLFEAEIGAIYAKELKELQKTRP